MIILHNPRCSKSRQALNILNEKNIDVEVVEYLKTPLSREELTKIIQQLGILPEKLVRKNETEFKEHFKGKNLTDEEWIDAMVSYPKLIERPIVIKNNKAIIGRPPEKVMEII